MTEAGFARLMTLFANDVAYVKYQKDTVPTTKTLAFFLIDGAYLRIFFEFLESETGNFSNFELYAAGDLLTTYLNVEFTKGVVNNLLQITFKFANG